MRMSAPSTPAYARCRIISSKAALVMTDPFRPCSGLSCRLRRPPRRRMVPLLWLVTRCSVLPTARTACTGSGTMVSARVVPAKEVIAS